MRPRHFILNPFYSVQDKVGGHYVPVKCCIWQINKFLAEMLLAEGHKVTVIAPTKSQGGSQVDRHAVKGDYPKYDLDIIRLAFPWNNLAQRLWFDAETWETILPGVDVVINHNEFHTSAIRQLAKKVNGTNTKIVHYNHLMPFGVNAWMAPRLKDSFNSADRVVVLSSRLAKAAQEFGAPLSKVSVWMASFPEFQVPQETRDIDLLFCQRPAADNYTRHNEFLAAIQVLRERKWTGRVVFSDKSKYLTSKGADEWEIFDKLEIEVAAAETREDYERLLARSKVAIAMMDDDLHGGVSIREAMFAGCVPLVTRTDAYKDMLLGLSTDSMYAIPMLRSSKPEDIVHGILEVFAKRPFENKTIVDRIKMVATRDSFENSWSREIRPDLEDLTRNL